jgi:hypothetical protein
MNSLLSGLIATSAMAIAALGVVTPALAASGWEGGVSRLDDSARVIRISDDWARAYVLGTMINEISRQQRVEQYFERHNCRMVDQPVTDDWGDIVDVQQVRVCR